MMERVTALVIVNAQSNMLSVLRKPAIHATTITKRQ
jgi:hypothetical protein